MTEEIKLLTNDEYRFAIHQRHLPDQKLTLIFTKGLRDYIQPVEENWQDYKSIELLFCLPDYWNLDSNPWPVEWLNKIAEVPLKKNTWFRPGDTISTGNPPIQFEAKMPKAHNFLLMRPELCKEFLEENESGIKYLAVTPIFDNELTFKVKASGTALINLLRQKAYTEKVDVYRQSVQRRRFGIF